jgi:hypothetical protein
VEESPIKEDGCVSEEEYSLIKAGGMGEGPERAAQEIGGILRDFVFDEDDEEGNLGGYIDDKVTL